MNYNTVQGFSGQVPLIPFSTAIGILIGVIGTVWAFKAVRNLLTGLKH